MKTHDWTNKLEDQIVSSILKGAISGLSLNKPDYAIETGLAHVFFFGDTVFKMYKTHYELDHFIKGVLAPTSKRSEFLEKDFTLNQHFGGSIYREIHSVAFAREKAHISPYDGKSIFALFEMERLDFSQNLHEKLLRGEVASTELKELGRHVAEMVDTANTVIPEGVSWYSLAKARVGFLTQFTDWLEDEALRDKIKTSGILEKLSTHLEENRKEYESFKGSSLVANIDCHDENIILNDGKVSIIDTLPPMSCWWYGLPVSNLCVLTTNVEVMHSADAAEEVKKGYQEYHNNNITDKEMAFSRAFSYTISAVHFGSVPEKNKIGWRYAERLHEVSSTLFS